MLLLVEPLDFSRVNRGAIAMPTPLAIAALHNGHASPTVPRQLSPVSGVFGQLVATQATAPQIDTPAAEEVPDEVQNKKSGYSAFMLQSNRYVHEQKVLQGKLGDEGLSHARRTFKQLYDTLVDKTGFEDEYEEWRETAGPQPDAAAASTDAIQVSHVRVVKTRVMGVTLIPLALFRIVYSSRSTSLNPNQRLR